MIDGSTEDKTKTPVAKGKLDLVVIIKLIVQLRMQILIQA